MRQDPAHWCRAGEKGQIREMGVQVESARTWGPVGEKKRNNEGFTGILRSTLSEVKSLGLR